MWRSTILLCCALAPSWAAEPDPKVVQADVAKLQGLWEVTKAEGNGKEVKEVVGIKIVVTGTKWVSVIDGDRVAGTFTIDPTAKVKTLDMVSKNIDDKASFFVRAIYRFDAADQVTLLFATQPILEGEKENPAKVKAARPANFDAPGFRGTLKRLAAKGEERELPVSVKPSVTWHIKIAEKDAPKKLPVTGDIPNGWKLVKSSYLTTAEQLSELWKVLQVGGVVPEINFAEQTVIVVETKGHGYLIHPNAEVASRRFAFAIGPERDGKHYSIVVFPKAAVDDLLAAVKKEGK